VHATRDALADTATVTVNDRPVAAVTVSPATSAVLLGGTVQLTATPRDAGGNPLSGRAVTWTTSAAGVATVGPGGLVAAQGAGTATITATSEGRSGTATVTVTLVPVASVGVTPSTLSLTGGQTGQLTATPRDAAGNPLSGRVVTWVTNAAGVATVSPAGLVGAQGAGSATITATCEGQSGTASVTVTLAPVASVSVTPSTLSLTVGQTGQLTATPRDAAGNPLTGRGVTWTTTAAAVATVNPTGLVLAQGVGTATIRATSEGQVGSATVTVTAVPVASVTVAPSSLSLQVGQTAQLTATPRDAAGNPLTGRVVVWTTSASGVATVNGSGLVTAQGVGTATIAATSEGKSGSASVQVSSGTGGTLLFSDTFDSGALGDPGRYQDLVGGGASIVTAAGEGITARSGTRVLKMGAPGAAITHFVATGAGPGYQRVYLRYWLYRTTAWEANNSGLRAGGIRGSVDQYGSFGVGFGTPGSCPDDPNNVNNQEFVFNYAFNDGAAWAQRVYANWLDQQKLQQNPPLCGGGYAQGAGNSPPATYHDVTFAPTANAWHLYEIETILNAPGSFSGSTRIWVDGVLKIEHVNVRYRTTSALTLWGITFDSGSVPAGAYYVDDVEVRTERP
jgi:uncharacterized protein YjdB